VARNEPDEVVFSFKYKVMKIQAFSTSSTAKAVPLLPLGEGKYEIAYIPPLKPSPFPAGEGLQKNNRFKLLFTYIYFTSSFHHIKYYFCKVKKMQKINSTEIYYLALLFAVNML